MKHRLFITILIVLLYSCVQKPEAVKLGKTLLAEQAPDSFTVKFETGKGAFTAMSKRIWSPKAVDRFYQLVKSGYFSNTAIFRVQEGYVAQFGISNDSTVNNFWNNSRVPEEPITLSNTKGVISFASDGPNTRTSQLFINLNDNYKLDTSKYMGAIGYPGIAKITQGFDVTGKFYKDYGFEPCEKQDSVYKYGNVWLEKNYPKLDYILKAEIIQ